jgi:hypothetical protein
VGEGEGRPSGVMRGEMERWWGDVIAKGGACGGARLRSEGRSGGPRWGGSWPLTRFGSTGPGSFQCRWHVGPRRPQLNSEQGRKKNLTVNSESIEVFG